MLENILLHFSTKSFSKTEAAQIVGGRVTLERLISEGKITADKPTDTQNGKWFCNAADVLRHMKDKRSTIKHKMK